MASDPTLGDLLGKHTDVSYNDPEPAINRKPVLLAVVICSMILSWLCVLFRLYTRLLVARSPGWDDFFVGVYLITTTMCSIAVSLGPDYGLGKHLLDLTYPEFTNFLHTFYFMLASYLTSTALIKLSLLFQYLRIFRKGTVLRRICIVLIVVTVLWGLAYSFIGWFPCFPVTDYWENPEGHTCYGYGVGMTDPDEFAATFESHAACNTVLDLLILAVPFPLLLEKKTSMRTKLGLLGLLTIGAVVNALSIWRLATVVQHKAGMYPAQDPTWYGPTSIILAVLEINVAAICASIPIFWPVIEEQFGKIFITQEIKITSEERWQSNFIDDQQSVSELTNIQPNHSSGDSVAEARKPGSLHRVTSSKDKYYDEFMLGQIDPLRGRKGSMPNAEAVIQSQNTERRKWWPLG